MVTTSDAGRPDMQTADEPVAPGRLSWPRGRWLGPALFAAAGLVLFAVYLAQARTVAASSEGGGQALQAWDMLHGNVLLHGWTLSDVSFYTTELPEYMLVELVHGLNADTVHVAAALSYTLIVLLAGLLAKGRATGREGLIRLLIAAGIMLAPTIGVTPLLLANPDHVGTHVPLLIIWLVLDRARPRWWVPPLVGILLIWAQIADTLVLFEAALPLAAICAVRMYRRRGERLGTWPEQWYDLSLAAAGLFSAVIARVVLIGIRHAGGFIVQTPIAQFAHAAALSSAIWPDIGRVLEVFGADFFGLPFGGAAAIALLHLVGVALAVCAVAVGLRRLLGETDLIVGVLSIAFVLVLAAYVFGTKQDANEIVGLLPIGAVLAGRLLTGRLISAGLIPALAVALVCYAGVFASNVFRSPAPSGPPVLSSWLEAHQLHTGLAGFWNATSVTVASGDHVQVRPVRMFGQRVVTTLWESDSTWYNPRANDANFVVTSAIQQHQQPCEGTCLSVPYLRAFFGQPTAIYRVAGYIVLTYDKNLLPSVQTWHWCGDVWPWNTPASPSPAACSN